MDFWIDNIGIIKDSSVRLDGLTVITGKNSSGKTTIGKALYAIIQANSNIESAFEQSKIAYVQSQLYSIWNSLTARRNYLIRFPQAFQELSVIEQILYVISSRYNKGFSQEELINWLYVARDTLPKLSMKDLSSFLDSNFPPREREREYYQVLSKQFDERKGIALEICSHAISIIEDPDAFHVFQRERIKAFLNLVFHNQIKPIKSRNALAQLRISSSDRTVLGLKLKSKSKLEFSTDSSFIIPFNRAIFIDDPFVLDRIESEKNYYFRYSIRDDDEATISPTDISTYSEQLKQLLTTKASINFFDDLDFQKKHRSIVEKINEIVPGEFQETNDGMFYVDCGTRLNVQNLATGSKLFFIIKLLFMNGYLNDETILILDEPESHLHPEWINKFAEILVLLIKEIKIHVLLTTHSPNLLLALNVFAKIHNATELSHFYLAKNIDGSWAANVACIDDNINEGYAHLSIPLIRMTLEQDALSGEQDDER